jgi:hypothetical protein
MRIAYLTGTDWEDADVSELSEDADGMRSVQVWFGGHLIIENTFPTAKAEWFEDAMRRHWKSCRVTSAPVPTERLVGR